MRRVVALGIDLIFVMVMTALLKIFLAAFGAGNSPGFLSSTVTPVLMFAYTFGFDCFSNGMSFGKMITMIAVERDDSVSKVKYALVHGIIRAMLLYVSWLWPVCIFLLLCGNGTMPYDRWLKVRFTHEGSLVKVSKNGVAVKRLGAFCVDWLLVSIAGIGAMGLLAPFLGMALWMFWPGLSVTLILLNFLRVLVIGVLLFLYTFACDCLAGGVTVGKKAAGLMIRQESMTTALFALCHSFLKTIAAELGPISLIIYLCCRGTRPYDRWLKMQIVEKKPAAHV